MVSVLALKKKTKKQFTHNYDPHSKLPSFFSVWRMKWPVDYTAWHKCECACLNHHFALYIFLSWHKFLILHVRCLTSSKEDLTDVVRLNQHCHLVGYINLVACACIAYLLIDGLSHVCQYKRTFNTTISSISLNSRLWTPRSLTRI